MITNDRARWNHGCDIAPVICGLHEGKLARRNGTAYATETFAKQYPQWAGQWAANVNRASWKSWLSAVSNCSKSVATEYYRPNTED